MQAGRLNYALSAQLLNNLDIWPLVLVLVRVNRNLRTERIDSLTRSEGGRDPAANAIPSPPANLGAERSLDHGIGKYCRRDFPSSRTGPSEGYPAPYGRGWEVVKQVKFWAVKDSTVLSFVVLLLTRLLPIRICWKIEVNATGS